MARLISLSTIIQALCLSALKFVTCDYYSPIATNCDQIFKWLLVNLLDFINNFKENFRNFKSFKFGLSRNQFAKINHIKIRIKVYLRSLNKSDDDGGSFSHCAFWYFWMPNYDFHCLSHWVLFNQLYAVSTCCNRLGAYQLGAISTY